MGVADFACEVNRGCFTVAVVEEVMLRCMAGRKLSLLSACTGVGEKGESSDELPVLDGCFVPSYGEGDVMLDADLSSPSGTALECRDSVCSESLVLRRGDRGGSEARRLSLLILRDGDDTMLKLLVGRAKGLVGRSAAWLI